MLCKRLLPTLVLCAQMTLGAASGQATDASPEGAEVSNALAWQTDYGTATELAQTQGKMLFLFFVDPQHAEAAERFEREVLGEAEIARRLAEWVCLRLPADASIPSDGQPQLLLRHPAFAEMAGQPGLAIIDYVHGDASYYGRVVSAFPFLGGRTYTRGEMAVISELPAGTLTQRTLIYAVRTHPDRPASTSGQFDPFLAHQAESHSLLQALLRRQGHHNWDSRFRLINARLPFGLLASEVCAESWPGQGLLQAALECVRSWRLSSGHWSKVGSPQQVYAYDMKRGNNGIWYATGIFGRR